MTTTDEKHRIILNLPRSIYELSKLVREICISRVLLYRGGIYVPYAPHSRAFIRNRSVSRLFHVAAPMIRVIHHDRNDRAPETLGEKLVSLDQKVSDIDHKLVNLKNQLDNNFLQSDDINAEASEKKPVSMSVIEITKAMSNEVMNHMTIEIENLKQATGSMDRKLQFHMNLVSDNLGAVYSMLSDVHEAVVDKNYSKNDRQILNVTTTEAPIKHSKIDRLVEQMYPMLTVSEKMDEVWNVVVSPEQSERE